MARQYSLGDIARIREKMLLLAAELFLKNGYTATTVKRIGDDAGYDKWTLLRIFGNKERLLAELVEFVLNEQFNHAERFLKDKTSDKILFYAAETTLQLYIVESSENIRELYTSAYSLPSTTRIIQENITHKLMYIFKEHLPDFTYTDFYTHEIASGGIMRGFMSTPCNELLPMEEKVKAFIKSAFGLYKVSDEKINEAIEFVSQFDFEKLAADTVQSMLDKIAQGKI